MTRLDLINAFFEGAGAILTWLNVLRIRRDREIKGIDWRISAFWSAWGLWNLHYYYAVGHMLSWAAGAVLVAGNICWVAHAIYYVREERQHAREIDEAIERYRASWRRPRECEHALLLDGVCESCGADVAQELCQ